MAAIVLALVAGYIREREKRENERMVKAEERNAAANQFIQELVERSLVAQTEQELAWRKMVEQDIAERAKIVKALDRVCERMASTERQHEAMLAMLQHSGSAGD